MGWANEVARSFRTLNYTFTTSGAYGTAGNCSFSMNLPHRNIADGGIHEEFSLPGFPESLQCLITHLHPYYRDFDGKDEWSTFFLPQLSYSLQSNGWLCNTVEEMETIGCEALRNLIKLPLWCIGPLLPSDMLKTNLVIESLSQGVPMIGCPLGAEQGFNAKMLVEKGVCVVLTTRGENRIVKEDVKKVIEVVFDRNDMRKKAT
ncbi:hypothetical protein LXL04_036326 [Taraxacum kok-saghyz]